MEALLGVTWFMPVLWVVFALSVFWAYHSFRAKRYGMVLLAGMIQIMISPAFAVSIGPIILAMGVTQFYVGIVNTKKGESYEA
ncbi:hypothetical protein [Halobacillus sp. BBL2006]|uniref:hypothetical protein n=1 Tax=Halobacillus sp. BBL2006 TaxID=1543706 RepID=UPI00054353FB|nr:hypothetical protein [Halobacillus sp. BBL2006]KHE67554.1 hypothetical protein LD39_16930 [Halobacillus sp. BBL2006]